MARLSLGLAALAVLAALVAAPGQYVAIGAGLGAVGMGRIAYARRTADGLSRIAGAGAMTVGALGVLLGLARVVIALAALGRLDSMMR